MAALAGPVFPLFTQFFDLTGTFFVTLLAILLWFD